MPPIIKDTELSIRHAANQHARRHRRKPVVEKPEPAPPTHEILSGQDYASQINLDQLPELLNPSEVSRVLRISRHMVYRLLENGTLAHIRIGPRCNRIYRESVRRLVMLKSSD